MILFQIDLLNSLYAVYSCIVLSERYLSKQLKHLGGFSENLSDNVPNVEYY